MAPNLFTSLLFITPWYFTLSLCLSLSLSLLSLIALLSEYYSIIIVWLFVFFFFFSICLQSNASQNHFFRVDLDRLKDDSLPPPPPLTLTKLCMLWPNCVLYDVCCNQSNQPNQTTTKCILVHQQQKQQHHHHCTNIP